MTAIQLTPEQIAKLKEEICKKGDLYEYSHTISAIVNKIIANNCTLSCCDTCERSALVQWRDNSKLNHIRIGMKEPRTKPVQLIWAVRSPSFRPTGV